MKATDYAYPIHAENHAGYLHFGITVRDYIAIQAMTAIISNASYVPEYSASEVAHLAYNYADAMIKESEVKDE